MRGSTLHLKVSSYSSGRVTGSRVRCASLLLNGFLTLVIIMTTHQSDSKIQNNVLLAEDDPKDRIEIRLHLELMGFVVYDTSRIGEAKEVFGERVFSLVIIHFSIRPLQSLELCRWLRAESNVPILMLTKRGELLDEQMVIAAGADDYISKPVDSNILSSRIVQTIRRGKSQRSPRANILLWGSMKMDLSTHEFRVAEIELHLSFRTNLSRILDGVPSNRKPQRPRVLLR